MVTSKRTGADLFRLWGLRVTRHAKMDFKEFFQREIEMKKILLAGALAATTMLGATTASAGIIQLGFILDRSGSVPEPDWGVITTGLADAMDNIPLPGDDTYEVSVVTFASSATIAIANRALTTVAEVDALKADILALDTQDTA